MGRTLLYNALIVNEGKSFKGCVTVCGTFIESVTPDSALTAEGEGSLEALKASADTLIDCRGGMLMPGVIDTHVHFRDPGLTEKADMATESRAAIAGGVTSYTDMPNTKPATVSNKALADKLGRAREVSEANYGFFIGATNDNIDEILSADYSRTAGVKLFLGSSTGNMLVDDNSTLRKIFSEAPSVIAVHAEDEASIASAREQLLRECGGSIPVERHPDVRPREACIAATHLALVLADSTGARLHVCHVSTAEELAMIKEAKARGVKVTVETCPQYLLFDRNDFNRLGARIKCNPAIKEASDRIALLRELLPGGVIDTIATDHAPHLLAQKEGDALSAASGMPMIQFSLRAMLELMETEPELSEFGPERVVELMCHRPADIFGIDRRGYIRPGYYADLVVVNHLDRPHKVSDSDVESRCGWTPLAGMALSTEVSLTMLNGSTAYRDGVHTPAPAMELRFRP